ENKSNRSQQNEQSCFRISNALLAERNQGATDAHEISRVRLFHSRLEIVHLLTSVLQGNALLQSPNDLQIMPSPSLSFLRREGERQPKIGCRIKQHPPP